MFGWKSKWGGEGHRSKLYSPCRLFLEPDPLALRCHAAACRDQTAAAIAGNLQASLASGVNLHARPAPGPDDVNWAALWSTWGQVGAWAVALTGGSPGCR